MKQKLSIVGLGFVGLSLAVVNAKKGYYTVGIDNDKKKLGMLKQGRTTFFEPNLKNYLKESLKRKNLFLTDDLKRILETDITFITIGTPTKSSQKIDLSSLKEVLSNLSKILKNKKSTHLIVIKSTVIPTTTKNILMSYFRKLNRVGIVVNPEFLREGNAIKDLLEPHLIVIGSDNNVHGKVLEKYYRSFYKKVPEIIKTNLSTAEMIKYSNNAFLATKISFINSIANICQNISNVDVNIVANAIGKDSRIGPEFLNAGPGFGGSCLPKDLSAFIGFSNKFGEINSFFKAVKKVNLHQPLQIIKLLNKMNLYQQGKTVSVLGLAFKKDTDDIRESVSINLVKKLLKQKMKVKVHDPMAMENFKKIFSNKVVYCENIRKCLTNADVCIVLTEWKEYQRIKQNDLIKNMKQANIIDTRRILEPKKFHDVNYVAIGLGN